MKTELSVVTTLYRSSEHIHEFYQRAVQQCEKLTSEFEIIFVNDGSPDDSLIKAIDIQKQDNRVKIIDLSRNFGHHKAMLTGLSHSCGELVFLIDSDLEEPIETLATFHNTLKKQSELDYIYGVQQSRKGNWFEKISGRIFYSIYNRLTKRPIEKNFLTVSLMTRRFVDALNKFQENEPIFANLISLNGFLSKPVTIEKGYKGHTSYNFFKKLIISLQLITSASNKPLWAIFAFGFLITLLSSAAFIVMLLNIFFNIMVIEPWEITLIAIAFIGGTILLSLGIIGIYLAEIYAEVKDRPRTIIRHIYQKE